MNDTARRDKRRNDFLELAAMILIANVAMILWLASGERGWLDTFLIWIATYCVVGFGWTVIIEKRRPGWPSIFKREPGESTADRLLGVIVALSLGVLNLTSEFWMPGARAYRDVPSSLLPASFDAVRLGLAFVVATSLAFTIWAALRLVVPHKPETEPAIVGASGRSAG